MVPPRYFQPSVPIGKVVLIVQEQSSKDSHLKAVHSESTQKLVELHSELMKKGNCGRVQVISIIAGARKLSVKGKAHIISFVSAQPSL
jgi:hypothetical protein